MKRDNFTLTGLNTVEILHGHLFCGIGAGAKGFNKARPSVGTMTDVARPHGLRYTSRKSSPSRGAGCGSPMESAAKSRHREVSGFFVGAPVLAALMGGREPCRFLLRRFPGLPHPSALPPNVEVGRQFLNGTCEANMANLSVGASAQITPFSFESHAVRIILRDGEPWFALTDVCTALDIENHRNVRARLDDDERDVQTMDTPGGRQPLSIINESGLYSVILTSRKPEAKRFKKWVTSEVLPSIRKTGGYSTTTQPTMQQIESAMSAAEAVAGPVKRTVMDAILKDNASWMHSRWLVSFVADSKYGAPAQVFSIPMDAMVASVDELARMIVEPGSGIHFSNVALANLAAACNQRLAERLEYAASRAALNAKTEKA